MCCRLSGFDQSEVRDPVRFREAFISGLLRQGGRDFGIAHPLLVDRLARSYKQQDGVQRLNVGLPFGM